MSDNEEMTPDTFNPVESDYVLPDGIEWTSPPCPGSIGSPANLDDRQAQVMENENAMREGRQARAIAIHCPFCGGYHIEMQPPVASLIGGEVITDYIDNFPPPVAPPPVDDAAVKAGIMAVSTVNDPEDNPESDVNEEAPESEPVSETQLGTRNGEPDPNADSDTVIDPEVEALLNDTRPDSDSR